MEDDVELTRPTGILESALYVNDLDRAEAFYTGVLGLAQIGRLDGRHVFFRCGTGVVLTFIAEETEKVSADAPLPVPPHGARGAGHICLAVLPDSLDAWRARLEAQGAVIEADFFWPSGARSIYVRDPAGNSVELGEPKLWD